MPVGSGVLRALALAVVLLPTLTSAAAQVVQPQGSAVTPAPAWEVPDAVGETCATYDGPTSAAVWLERAWQALGIPHDGILHIHFLDRALQLIQSDRTYPPYLPSGTGGEIWIDPESGVIRESSTTIFPSAGRWGSRNVRLYDEDASWVTRDSALVPVPRLHPFTRTSRAMDPISAIREWRSAAAVRAPRVCRYRGEERLVLERDGRWGPERLYLDQETGLPVKTDAIVPHYLWGQVREEIVWATWWAAGGVDRMSPYPVGITRLLDGGVVEDRAVGIQTWIPRAHGPAMDPPRPGAPMDAGNPGSLESAPPDTVRISERTFLLASPAYTHVVTLQRDTIWILDATLGESRARQDHDWIRRLFGDNHALAVVVTDLAWPHVAGVRYWVSQGATVVSDARSAAFLRRVVDRAWTLRSDALEDRRADITFRFRPVRDSLVLAGGAVQVFPIGGIGSETAVMVWLPEERFLWAGDYVQDVTKPTTYGSEVWQAVQRLGLSPERFAAQHHPLAEWVALDSVFKQR